MAIADLIGATLANPPIETVGSLLLSGNRSIMGLFADVVIEEQHTDELNITDHPVEKGSNISDHAYLAPPEVTMELGWSESAGRLNSLLGNGFIGSALNSISLVAIYQGLLALQGNKTLLVVSTGKRLYKDMLIKSLSVTTDADTENCLMVKVTFRKVFIATTQDAMVLVEQQKEPEKTAPVQEGGTKQAEKTVRRSTLDRLADGAKGGETFGAGFNRLWNKGIENFNFLSGMGP